MQGHLQSIGADVVPVTVSTLSGPKARKRTIKYTECPSYCYRSY